MSECADRRCKRLLVERDVRTMAAGDELFETMNDLVALDSVTRIAFVTPHTTVAESRQHAVDHGTGHDGDYRFFRSKDKAVEWLLQGIEIEKDSKY
jgi:hypothetical protein